MSTFPHNTVANPFFAHLHSHTPQGSLLDGFCRIDPMIKLAKEFGMDAIGISDHGTCFAHFEFYQKCKAAGIHPVLGMEGYICPKKEWRKADFEAVKYTDLRYLTKEELEGYDRYEKVKEQAVDPEGNPMFLKNGKPKMVTVSRFVEHVPPAYPNHVKLEKKEAQSFTLSQPITDEHLMFLKTLEESDPERYGTFKKSTRWYLCGIKDDSQKRLFEWSPRIAHLLMIAKNNEGYKNLLKLTTIGHLEGYYGKPRIDYHDIKKHGKGIIATSSCFPKGTLVNTTNGLKDISSILPGETVMSHKGVVRDVITPTTRHYDGELYKIQTRGSAFNIESTHNHKFLTIPNIMSSSFPYSSYDKDEEYVKSMELGESITKGRRKFYRHNACLIEPEWVEAENLTKEHTILSPIDETVKNINSLDISFARKENARYHLKTYDLKIDGELLEILGLYAAEGSLDTTTRNKISFTIDSEKPHLYSKIHNFFKERFGIKAHLYKKKDSQTMNVEIMSIEIYELFSTWFKSGAINKAVPDFIKYLEPSLQMYFVKGLFLGDGYFRFRKDSRNKDWAETCSVSFSTISKQLVTDVAHIFHRNYINPTVSTYPEKVDKDGVHHCEWYSSELNGGIAKALHSFIWCDEELQILYSMRKMKDIPFIWNNKKYMKHTVVDVKSRPYSGDVYCLTVEEDHSFVAEGLIVHNCLGGTIPLLIRKGRTRVAKNHIKFYQKCFDEFYLEIQPSTMPEQILVNEVLMEWSKELNIPLVATSDAHMLRPEDRPVHKAITSINKGKEDDENDIDVYEHCMFYSAQEMLDMGMPPEALQNAYDIAHKCHVDLDNSDIKYPKYAVPKGHTFDSYLRELAEDGLMERVFGGNFQGRNIFNVYQEYKDRLDFELEVIAKKGLSAYMVIVYDYINFAKRKGILVGPGRGSAAGSLVSYVLQITNLDPIKYNLLFERFLNPERPGFPDVDTDFSYLRRHEVIEYVTEKYGAAQVAQIATFGTLSTKSALKDIGRALGIDHNIINDMNKLVPSHNGEVMPISDVLEEIPEFKEFQAKYPRLFELALEVENMPRTQGIHACFDAETLITTIDGYKYIKDIQVGDKVLTHMKRFKEVGEIMVTHSDDIYNVSVAGTMPIEVTGNHPLYARNFVQRKGTLNGKKTSWKEYGEPKWISVQELSVGEHYIGIAINQESKLPDSNIGLPFHNRNFWWLIGRYIGDGWTENPKRNAERGWCDYRVIICCDKNTDNELNSILSRLDGMFDYRVEEARTTYKIYIKSTLLYKYLTQFGRLAHGKYLTGDIVNLPHELLKEFLNGYFSADGSYNSEKDIYSFKTVSKQLANSVIACIHKVYKRHCSIGYVPPKVEVIEGRTVNSKEKFNVSFSFEKRKRDQSFYEDGYIWSKVKKIEKTDKQKDMYNLAVFDDSSYMANHIIAHNCGLLISPTPIADEVPLIRGKEEFDRVAAYDGPTLEEKNYIKFDFLGLKNLSVIDLCREMISERHGVYIDVDNLEPDDRSPQDLAAFRMIKAGETDGVFQLESSGMKQMFSGFNNVSFETLIAGLSLYRPGPLEYVPKFTALANGIDEIPKVHPEYDEITKNTFSIMIYQEQVMQVSQRMAGYSAGEADVLRKAVGNFIAV